MSQKYYRGIIHKIDLKILENSNAHHTNEYDLCQKADNADPMTEVEPPLIVRRGQTFDIEIRLSEEMKEIDMRLAFSSGGTRAEFPVTTKKVDNKWGAWVIGDDRRTLCLRVNTPPTCFIGIWKLQVEIKRMSEYYEVHDVSRNIYVLFNAWCKDDPVYLADEKLREEYVLNEDGKVYVGSYKTEYGKPWEFGQFDEDVVDCTLELLTSQLPNAMERADPARIARVLSACGNACDGFGILIGNWSGDYADGTKPTVWTSSVDIISQYRKTKAPVKYGQCWVFSGLLTTLCRSLGIPARSVTNFGSAHDTDKSLTIDKMINEDGKLVSPTNDSIWNFHVWVECWMTRNDLPKGYGGWQAIDSTPQEPSDYIFQCGPAPLKAVKEGDMDIGQDTRFVFAEVNADVVTTRMTKSGKPKVCRVQRNRVGHHVSTKSPGSGSTEDITDQYKYKEDTPEERMTFKKAMKGSKHEGRQEYYEQLTSDVDFTLHEEDVTIGQDETCTLTIENKSKEKRTINGNLELLSVTYNSDGRQKELKTIPVKEKLEGKSKKVIQLTSCYKDYADKLFESCYMKLILTAHVQETNFAVYDEDKFRLRKPELEVKAKSSTCKCDHNLEITISFKNPLSCKLTDSKIEWTGRGLSEKKGVITFENGTIEKDFCKTITVTPKKPGPKSIQFNLDSNELEMVDGYVSFLVFI